MAFFFPNNDGTPVDLTAATEKLLQEAAEELIRTISAVRAGEMDHIPAAKTAVKGLIRNIDPLVPIRTVHASRSKQARAEPVAALYEQGRVFHVRGLSALEEQMCRMSGQGYAGKGSPDRVDALVWALSDLIVEPGAAHVAPKVRTLG